MEMIPIEVKAPENNENLSCLLVSHLHKTEIGFQIGTLVSPDVQSGHLTG